MKAYDFDGTNCAPCRDPGSGFFYIPGDTIPDGLGGTLAAWTENQGTIAQFQLSEHIHHIDSFGGVADYNLPGIDLVPTNLSADMGENLVLGENNIAFGIGSKIAAFDVTSGAEVCSTPFLAPKGAALVAPISGGGLLAAELTSPVFGGTDAIESLDSSCAASVSPLPSTLAGVSVFDTGKLLALAAGSGEMLLGTGVITALDPATWFPKGNVAVQRAPVPPRITYDKQVVKAGISLIGKDVRGTVRATIKPKSAASKVTFISTNRARATVAEESRVDGADSTTVTLRITGIAETPTNKPTGDAHVRALFAGQPRGIKIPILVVVPATQEHAIGTTTLTNTSFQMTTPSFKFVLRTDVTNVVTITIRD